MADYADGFQKHVRNINVVHKMGHHLPAFNFGEILKKIISTLPSIHQPVLILITGAKTLGFKLKTFEVTAHDRNQIFYFHFVLFKIFYKKI